jgi:hypothetical protein
MPARARAERDIAQTRRRGIISLLASVGLVASAIIIGLLTSWDLAPLLAIIGAAATVAASSSIGSILSIPKKRDKSKRIDMLISGIKEQEWTSSHGRPGGFDG